MDEVRHLESVEQFINYIDRAKETQHLSPDFLLIILGPTASGKTKIAVRLADHYDGEIISADSRQVYQRLNIGSGKDLQDYGNIPYHVIDVCQPSDRYAVNNFRTDFTNAYKAIRARDRQAILCGGTGSYIQAVLQDQPYSRIPVCDDFHRQHSEQSLADLIVSVQQYPLPSDFSIDFSSKKRVIRAIEIMEYLKKHPLPHATTQPIREYLMIGLKPELQQRRNLIENRLNQRLDEGLIQEVEELLESGITPQRLEWLGLEYKYASYYLKGILSKADFKKKLNTEINRFAKRQMTYFRKMEKDGLVIHWFQP